MLPGRLRKTSLWSPLGHLKMRCSCLTLVCCEDKELSAVSVRQTDVFRAALRVLTFRQRSLQKATCGRDVMISFSHFPLHVITNMQCLLHWIHFFFTTLTASWIWKIHSCFVCICYCYCSQIAGNRRWCQEHYRCRSLVALHGPNLFQ